MLDLAMSQWITTPAGSVVGPAPGVEGVKFTGTTSIFTTESGGTPTTFSVELNTQPAAGSTTTVGLSSSNGAEGVLSSDNGVTYATAVSLTFTDLNWNVPQPIKVLGVDDFVVDGNVIYTVTSAPLVSTDPKYNGINPADLSALNIDNDGGPTPGILVAPASGLLTKEDGSAALFAVVLQTAPTANVTIGLSSSNVAEGAVAPASLTFTTANWGTPQIVTVTGQNDFVVDGNTNYNIVTAAATSTDPSYNGLNPVDVSLANVDDDVIGITISSTAINTSENGAIASFSAVLNSQPTANVTFGLASSDLSEGNIAPASLTFTTANWNAPQTVTITPADDVLVDGDIVYTITTAAATSTDAAYNGVNPADVTVTNFDNDGGGAPGIHVTPSTGLITSEAGGTAQFGVVLQSAPTANVTIGLASSNAAEGTVGVASLTFTPLNWNLPQSVTVTGVDDPVQDGNTGYTIVTAAATSTDPNYNALNANDIAVTNTDNDVIGISVSTTALQTSENGGIAQFSLLLNTQPTANVTIGLSSGDLSEGTVSPASVTFTPANWNVAQNVTVTAVDDALLDGDIVYTVTTAAATSTDPNYNLLNPADVSVTNFDNDGGGVPGIHITPSSGLVTTESGGAAQFGVVLQSAPTANVTIGLSSNNVAEGTVGAASITFTPANWNTPQAVSVSGVDDALQDGAVGYTIVTAAATSTDPNYNGLNPNDVAVTNSDNDTAIISITPGSTVYVGESLSTDTFTAVLGSQPSANVSFVVTSSDPTEGLVSLDNITFNPSLTVTFTAANWNVPQTIYVRGVNDALVDGDIAYTINFSGLATTDPNYTAAGLPAAIPALTFDNDVTGVPPAGVHVIRTSGVVTSEAGGTDTISYVLQSIPAANVTITLTGFAAEGTIAPSVLTFTPANWNVPQTVTVTGVNDFILDGDQVYSITGAATSTDAAYNGIAISSVLVTNIANTPGVLVNPATGLSVSESGTTVVFWVVLQSKPTANVTVPISSPLTTEEQVSVDNITYGATANLTFTSLNWNIPQPIYVKGIDDFIADGNQAVTIATGTTVSTDADYNATINPPDVVVTNVDNDTAGVTVISSNAFVTDESGLSYSFTVVLNSDPAATVTVPLAVSDATEATLNLPSLTFTSANWNTPQTVIVTGADDLIVDGTIAYTVTIGAATAPVGNPYNGLAASIPSISGSNFDNDTGAVIDFNVAATTINLNEGDDGVFYVVLNSPPTGNVVITVTNNAPAQLLITSPFKAVSGDLTFTSANWNVAQPVLFRTEDYQYDGVMVSPYTFTVALNAGTTTDLGYLGAGLAAKTVTVNLAHNDKRVFLIRSAAGTASGFSGAQDVNATGSGIDDLDTLCNAAPNKVAAIGAAGVAKVLAVDGSTRTACTSPNCSTLGPAEHLNWPLTPNTFYFSQHMTAAGPTYSLLPSFRTNGLGIFIGKPGNILINPFHEANAYGIWMGLMPDWTTSVDTCVKWTNGTGGNKGETGGARKNDIQAFSWPPSQACNIGYVILCVEQ